MNFNPLKFKNQSVGWSEVFRISWPLIVASSFWNIQMTIDRIFLGQFSTDALAAAMATMGIFWTPMALLQQTAAYLATFVAQYVGAERSREVGAAVWQSVYVSLAGGILFLGLIPLSVYFFEAVGHSPSLQVKEVEYFSSLAYSALPTALVAAASAFFTGMGKSSVVMWINGVGMITNIVIDYLLIFGNFGFPAWGIFGAGVATTIANWVAAVFGFALVFRSQYRQPYALIEGWRLNVSLMRRFLKYGLPSGLQWSLEGLAWTVFLLILGWLPNGEAALAASSIAVTIMMLAVIPNIGMGQGVSVLVGQYLGADQPDKAYDATWSGVQIAMLYTLAIGMTFWLIPELYISWFEPKVMNANWQEARTIVPWLLLFVAAFTFFDCMSLVFSFALKGAGDTRFVSVVALVLPWPLMILPSSFFLASADGVYWAWAFSSIFIIVQGLVFWRRFQGGKWRLMRVIEPLD